MIILAELGDKTQLAAFALTAKAGGSFLIFLGVSLVFLVVTAIGVAVGSSAPKAVPMR